MGEIKWIHIATGIFDDEKIKLIEEMPDADSIIVIWFKLLCLAGTQNGDGVITLTDRIHYTDKMLATIFRRKETTVSLALETFEQFGMIERVDGLITIPKWDKHQNIEGLEKIREGNRRRQAAFRDRVKQKLITSNVTSNECVTESNAVDKIRKEEIKKEEIIEEDKSSLSEDRPTVGEIIALYNVMCPALPSVRSISDARRKAIKARLNQYSVDEIEQVFQKAQDSTFLKGGNNHNWMANFDWLMNGTNFAKVLDGNYDDRTGAPQQSGGVRPKGAEELEASYKMMAEWAEGGNR